MRTACRSWYTVNIAYDSVVAGDVAETYESEPLCDCGGVLEVKFDDESVWSLDENAQKVAETGVHITVIFVMGEINQPALEREVHFYSFISIRREKRPLNLVCCVCLVEPSIWIRAYVGRHMPIVELCALYKTKYACSYCEIATCRRNQVMLIKKIMNATVYKDGVLAGMT